MQSKTEAFLPEKEPAIYLPPYKKEGCFSSLEGAVGFINIYMVRELDVIPSAPDGTIHLGAHILKSKDTGVDGVVLENAITYCGEIFY